MDDFAVLVARYGLAAVFLFTFLENIGLPDSGVPGADARGAYASTRHATLLMIVGAAVAGALLADAIWYLVGRWKRESGCSMHLCRISFNPDACLERAVDGFHRRMAATILFAKFLPGVNTIMPPLAGVSAVPVPRLPAAGPGRSAPVGRGGRRLGIRLRGAGRRDGARRAGDDGAAPPRRARRHVAWRVAYRFWLVKRYGGNRVDPDEVHRRMREGEDLLVIDLRRDDDFAASDRMIAGAARLRPASFHRHADAPPAGPRPGVLLHLTGRGHQRQSGADPHQAGVRPGGSAPRRVRRMGPAGPSHAAQDGGGPPARKRSLSGGCARFQQFRLTEPGAGIIFSGLPYHVPW